MNLTWIDPLHLTLGSSDRDGSLLVVRQNFGSEAHFRSLAAILTAVEVDGITAIIDLTPFQRLGNRDAFRRLLLSAGLLEKAFLLVASRTLFEDLNTIAPEHEALGQVRVILFELRAGQLVATASDSLERLQAQAFSVGEMGTIADITYNRLRMRVVEADLLTWVNGVTLKPPDDRWKGGTERLGDKDYLRMPNGMLVTHFVLMKALLHQAETVDRIAYEVAAHACQGFSSEADDRWPEMFVASSDHAYLIGAAVQRLTGVKCAVIDRIGLLPGRRLTRDTISLDVTGKRIALIVDVSATASEMERAASLLVHRGAHLQMIVCCVWLECALPRFVDWFPFVPLCKPKAGLNFVYRSAP